MSPLFGGRLLTNSLCEVWGRVLTNLLCDVWGASTHKVQLFFNFYGGEGRVLTNLLSEFRGASVLTKFCVFLIVWGASTHKFCCG